MTTKFRVGDVVARCLYLKKGAPCTHAGNCEARVVSVGSDDAVVIPDGDCTGIEYYTDDLTLLRRPVQVGDRIVMLNGSHETVIKDCHLQIPLRRTPEELVGLWSKWRHLDGTPIDPPQKTEPVNANAAVTDSQRANRISDATDRAFARHHMDAVERANRLSDECGRLKADLDDAHRTIGQQQREIERLKKEQP